MWKWSTAWEHWYRRALPAYWIFLFCATHLPKARLPGVIPREDKLAHFLAFGALAFLFWKFAQSFDRKLSARFIWIAGIVLGGYAALDEYLQQFVNRHTSLNDWLADLVGIGVVLLVLEILRRRDNARPDTDSVK